LSFVIDQKFGVVFACLRLLTNDKGQVRNMLISYEPMSDVLSITVASAPVAQTQVQGTVQVGFDAAGGVVSISIPGASSLLWENGGQINVALPVATPATTTVVETTRVVERPVL
jgi:uncharacterized protein YuzE